MKTVLVCQHEAGDDLRQWRPLFRSLGLRPRRCDFSRHPQARPSLRGAAGLVLLGGAVGVHEAPRRPHLAWEMGLVRQAAAKDLPVLGICLGGQLIAKALGGRVRRSARPEIGWLPIAATPAGRRDPLFDGFGDRDRVFQWHNDEFDPPPGATTLASSAHCRHQAFRLRAKTLAAQFHFEIDRRTIEAWLAEASNLPPRRKAELRKRTDAALSRSVLLGERIWRSFAKRLG